MCQKILCQWYYFALSTMLCFVIVLSFCAFWFSGFNSNKNDPMVIDIPFEGTAYLDNLEQIAYAIAFHSLRRAPHLH